MSRENLILFSFLVGSISGYLSAFVAGFHFMPGVLFGVIVGFYLLITGLIKDYKKYFSFIFVSTISYFAAYITYLVTPFRILFPSSFILSLISAGAAGSFLLLSSFRTLVAPLDSKAFFGLFVFGTVLSLSAIIGNTDFTDIYGYYTVFTHDFNYASDTSDFFSLFIVWQAGMAAGIVWAVTQPKKK